MTKKGNILLVTVALGSFAAGWITNTLFKKKKSTSSTESHERKIDDSELVESLLAQDLKNRTFKFADVIFHSTERKVLAFDPKNENHQEIASMILKAATE